MKKKNKYRPLPDYLTIQPSKIEGLGLFAIKDIPAYEVIGMTHAKWYGEPDNLLRTPLGDTFLIFFFVVDKGKSFR